MTIDTRPKMYYFGPWDGAGHHLRDEYGRIVHYDGTATPWDPWSNDHGIDGQLQVGCKRSPSGQWQLATKQPEGVAIVHHKDGWTALSFWDRSVDTRPGCNSTYFAEGTFTFEQMVELAKTRFARRWQVMKFEVVQAVEPRKCPAHNLAECLRGCSFHECREVETGDPE